MKVQCFFSSPKGDISLDYQDLRMPLKITPALNHAFLTLGDYFESIKRFIFIENGRPLFSLLSERMFSSIVLEDIEKIVIRSEKHGIFYHIASAELFSGSQSSKFTVSTAISKQGKACLNHDYDTLRFLSNTYQLPYLPKPYFKADIRCSCGTREESLSMLLSEWFTDYHEWHLTEDDEVRGQNICLWDQNRGYRFVSDEDYYEILRQASKILTLYYDTKSYKQIYPWHHAAGDFVVKTRHGRVDVKLTTARNYKSVVDLLSNHPVKPITALVYFFLDLSLRMRLDRINGIGKVLFAKEASVESVVKGFLDALCIMETEERYHCGKVKDLVILLKSFSVEELEKLFASFLVLYQDENPEDLPLIGTELCNHVIQLHKVIERLR